MECTQRLDFECSQTERICPDQIGFLGILGTKYPVVRGPNKIGRDPHTCSIVLNKNSISRQHAVINVLNGTNYMLMDLDSANKTRLNNKSLQPYIPVPISNGDTVQFGEVFGIFRLLDEQTDLPCTQAIDLPCTQVVDIPETPTVYKNVTRFKQAIIPESPDVSDKEDSFMLPSQPKLNPFKSPSNKFIKTSGKTIAIQPIGTNKIDNIFWSSSKKSNSFNLDDSTSTNNSLNGDIHEMETQEPEHKSVDSIYTAETQIPHTNNSPSIHSQNTQLPIHEKNPGVCKINNQSKVGVDLHSNKENESIFNAETQDIVGEQNIFEANTQLPVKFNKTANKNVNDENTQLPYNNSPENNNIFEAQTQLPFDKLSIKSSKNDIFEANTQFPFEKQSDSDNMFEAETQLPFGNSSEENKNHDVFEANTQMPSEIKLLENTQKSASKSESINNLSDTIRLSNQKSNETMSKSITESKQLNKSSNIKTTDSKELNKSNEEILFNDLDTQSFIDDFQSQPILGSENVNPEQQGSNPDNEEEIPLSQSDTITDEDFIEHQNDNIEELSQVKPTKRNVRIESDSSSENTEILSQVKPTKRNVRIESDESTDCEDVNILPTQKIQEKNVTEDELTDCEDETDTVAKNTDNKLVENSPKINFEDLATQVIPEDNAENNKSTDANNSLEKSVEPPCFEDMPTQVIPEEKSEKDNNFEDLPTQVIPEDVQYRPFVKESSQFSEEIISPFKIPLQAAKRMKKKETSKTSDSTSAKSSPLIKTKLYTEEDDEKYYTATQEIFDDLCTQTDEKPTNISSNVVKLHSEQTVDEISISALHYGGSSEKVPGKKIVRDDSTDSNEGEDKVNKFVSSLSVKQISDVIGANVSLPRKVPSDPSDLETTPKKVRPLKFMQTELPDSQEIKTSVSLSSRTIATDSSSDSETEKESQEQTPILFRKKKRAKAEVKQDLTMKFDAQALPTRIITRTRKPSSKVQESDAATKKRSAYILRPKYLTEQDDEVDSDIITENITRLRHKNDKKSKNDEKTTIKKDDTIDLVSDIKPVSEKRQINSSRDNDVVDLTNIDENVSETKNKVDISGTSDSSINKSKNKSKPIKSKSTKIKDHEVIENNTQNDNEKISKNVISSESSKLRPKRKETQDKITNYTISNAIKDKSTSSTSRTDKSLNSTNETNKSTRSTRTKNKDKEIKSDHTQEDTLEKETKRKRGRPRKENKVDDKEKKSEDTVNTSKRRKKASNEKDVSVKESRDKSKEKEQIVEQPEIRRSRRQKTVKEKVETQPKITRSHEQSTVYNISSESGAESPKSIKRAATLDIDAPSPKRTRSVVSLSSASDTTSGVTSTEVSSNSSSRRSTPYRLQVHKVLFTAFPSEEVKEKLEKLGATIVSDVLSCSVVLTLQLRRTFKLLCAVGLGRPIVGPAWVQACVDTNTIVDPWQYLLHDASSETRFKFSLRRTLSGPRHYLRGLAVSATPSVLPSAPEMKLIVECSGGTWGEGAARGRRGCSGDPRWVVVTCGADRALWPAVAARGGTLVTPEFILTGVLTQHLDIDAYAIK